jgi:hypothetical protein
LSSYPRIPNSPRTCVKCGKIYQPNSGFQKFCPEHKSKQRESSSYWVRTCDRCAQTFQARGWRQRFCLSCRKQAYREYAREQNKIYYHRHPDRVMESVKRTRAKRPEYYREQKRKNVIKTRRRARQAVLEHYSNGTISCACCDEGEEEFLTIDHVEGNGGKERTALFGRRDTGGYRFYAWLIRNHFPTGYQVLCMNCNFSKRRGNVCAHKRRLGELAGNLVGEEN